MYTGQVQNKSQPYSIQTRASFHIYFLCGMQFFTWSFRETGYHTLKALCLFCRFTFIYMYTHTLEHTIYILANMDVLKKASHKNTAQHWTFLCHQEPKLSSTMRMTSKYSWLSAEYHLTPKIHNIHILKTNSSCHWNHEK